MGHTLLIFCVALFALAAFALYAALSQEKERRNAFAHAAVRLGMQFELRADALIEEYGVLPLFSQGHSRHVANVLRGGGGDRPAAVFDYQYTTGGGQRSTTSRQTVAVFTLAGLPLPSFTMEPEGALQKLGELFGYRDVDFEHQPGFSEVYFLRGQDEPAMRQLFQPALLAHLQQMPGWHIEGHEDRLAVYRAGRRVKPEGLFEFVEETARVAQIFRGA
jgi:hypothetical protein